MKISTQSAKELGLTVDQLLDGLQLHEYVSGRGYGSSHAIDEAMEKFKNSRDDTYILVKARVSTSRTSHPNSDFGDYNVFLTGDLYKLPTVEPAL